MDEKRRSFDVIGGIGIIESESTKEEKALVKRVTETHPRIKTVLKKEGEIKGKYRLKKYKIVFKDLKKIRESGLGTTETIHKEHGCRYKLDVKKAFFNPREATIREKIANKVKRGERVLVLFSGVAPYPIIIAKRTDCEVVGVEWNPAAAVYGDENVKLNKLIGRVKLFQGGARKVRLRGKFDRIIMPKVMAYKYLDIAFKYSKKGSVIHLYGLGEKKDPYKQIEEHVDKAAKNAKKKIKIVERGIVLPYSPALEKVCVGVKVI